jgi:hypothetical protein
MRSSSISRFPSPSNKPLCRVPHPSPGSAGGAGAQANTPPEQPIYVPVSAQQKSGLSPTEYFDRLRLFQYSHPYLQKQAAEGGGGVLTCRFLIIFLSGVEISQNKRARLWIKDAFTLKNMRFPKPIIVSYLSGELERNGTTLYFAKGFLIEKSTKLEKSHQLRSIRTN